jgi:hypothetical protein
MIETSGSGLTTIGVRNASDGFLLAISYGAPYMPAPRAGYSSSGTWQSA